MMGNRRVAAIVLFGQFALTADFPLGIDRFLGAAGSLDGDFLEIVGAAIGTVRAGVSAAVVGFASIVILTWYSSRQAVGS